MARDYLAQALADAGAVELRHQDGDRWVSGVFNDLDALRSTAVDAGRRGNLYSTLNAPRDAQITNAMTGAALSDEDISTIVRLPFDFDPVRGKDMPSTEEELELARKQRGRLVDVLSAAGWPRPAVATSGNGAHAVYRCRLPSNPTTHEMFDVLYRGLREDYTTEQVLFDVKVRNPSRIWRLYGSLNRKGTPTVERPHRLATVAIPQRWEGVSPRQIETLANRYAKKRTPTTTLHRPSIAIDGLGDYSTLHVAGWFAAHGLYKRPLGSGKHAVQCPWSGDHTTSSTPTSTDTVVWDAHDAVWPTFTCAHDHCDGRSIIDVLHLFGDADAFCARPFVRRVA